VLWRGEAKQGLSKAAGWHGFVTQFLKVLIGGAGAVYLFILLVDPYGVVPFSLPLERRIVGINQRYMYPQIVRSKRFDSLILGSSTSRLLDPERLDRPFQARFANLAMDSATAWEQQAMLDLFLRDVGPPKVLIVGLDAVWCYQDADRQRITFRGFPDWLYDDNPWNDYLYMFNAGALQIAVRLVGYQLGLYRERIRPDGYNVFLPPDSQYDAARARARIGAAVPLPRPPPLLVPLSADERRRLSFPALGWLDAGLARLPASSRKILAFMPVNVAAQPTPGTREAGVEDECKARIAAIGRDRGASVIDWRIPSPLTRDDANYWDELHYREPIATRIADQLGAAVLAGRPSGDGSYVVLVP
jgi:hypothetical protein